jgi:DNA processing protein
LAVLGCGLAVDYPRGHRTLAQEVAACGAQLSEFASQTQPRPWNFPLRNRSIAALSAGTLVVRASPRSGALITARHALDLGKTVWAVPGSIFDELSLGPNALLREGAAPALHPRDLLDELLPHGASRTNGGGALPRVACAPVDAPEEEAPPPLPPGLPGQLLAALSEGEAVAAEELALRVDAPVDQVLTVLLDLEIEGLVRKRAGFGYAR